MYEIELSERARRVFQGMPEGSRLIVAAALSQIKQAGVQAATSKPHQIEGYLYYEVGTPVARIFFHLSDDGIIRVPRIIRR